MKAFIIEDEIPAQHFLVSSLERLCPDVEVVAFAESVRESVEWLQDKANHADVIFMDVELQDGSAFEIFKRVRIASKVIMTTAFDRYALKAFEAGSIDYLLKPFDDQALLRAVKRCRETVGKADIDKLLATMKHMPQRGTRQFRDRLVVRVGRQIIPVPASEIAYFYVVGKNRIIVMDNGRRYAFDQKMDDILQELDPQVFFRISRNCAVSFHAIKEIESIGGGRYKLLLSPAPEEDILVSRGKAQDFLDWLS